MIFSYCRKHEYKSIAALVFAFASFLNAADEGRWWPVQAMPKALVRLEEVNKFSGDRASFEMTAQSVAGLAAKAVNEGRRDEMV